MKKFEIGKVYTGKIEKQSFRFKAVSKTPAGNVFFEDMDDFFWYLNTATARLVIMGTIYHGEAMLMDPKGYGITLQA